MKDYYKILDVKSTASQEEIHARWIELMRRFHPDRQPVGGAEAERLKEINEAYGVLKHSSARAHYDLQRAYYRKKKRLYLQRVITPPAVFIILLILGLVYLQRPGSVRPAKSSLPSTRGSVHSETNPLSSPVDNELSDPNQTNPRNLMNVTNQQAEIDRMDQLDQRESPRHPNPTPTPKSHHSNTETDKINQKDQKDETNQINQKTQPLPMSVSKKRKASPLFAKAETSVKTNTPVSPPKPPRKTRLHSEMNQINQTNEKDETHEINQIDQTNGIDEINQTNDLNDMKARNNPNTLHAQNEPNDSNTLNALNVLNQGNQADESNQIIAQLNQLSPVITEEGVNQFLQLYKEHYISQDIDAFLSLFSPRALQNGRDGIDEIKKIYSDFFHQSHELGYQLEDTRIAIYHEPLIHGLFYEYAVTVEARYQVDQTLIKKGEKKVWRGNIRWILVTENGALKVLHLDFTPEKSP